MRIVCVCVCACAYFVQARLNHLMDEATEMRKEMSAKRVEYEGKLEQEADARERTESQLAEKTAQLTQVSPCPSPSPSPSPISLSCNLAPVLTSFRLSLPPAQFCLPTTTLHFNVFALSGMRADAE